MFHIKHNTANPRDIAHEAYHPNITTGRNSKDILRKEICMKCLRAAWQCSTLHRLVGITQTPGSIRRTYNLELLSLVNLHSH